MEELGGLQISNLRRSPLGNKDTHTEDTATQKPIWDQITFPNKRQMICSRVEYKAKRWTEAQNGTRLTFGTPYLFPAVWNGHETCLPLIHPISSCAFFHLTHTVYRNKWSSRNELNSMKQTHLPSAGHYQWLKSTYSKGGKVKCALCSHIRTLAFLPLDYQVFIAARQTYQVLRASEAHRCPLIHAGELSSATTQRIFTVSMNTWTGFPSRTSLHNVRWSHIVQRWET